MVFITALCKVGERRDKLDIMLFLAFHLTDNNFVVWFCRGSIWGSDLVTELEVLFPPPPEFYYNSTIMWLIENMPDGENVIGSWIWRGCIYCTFKPSCKVQNEIWMAPAAGFIWKVFPGLCLWIGWFNLFNFNEKWLKIWLLIESNGVILTQLANTT